MTDKTKIADSFNDYFASIGKITGQNVPKTKTNYTNYLKTPVLNSIYLENVEPNQVADIINKLILHISHSVEQMGKNSSSIQVPGKESNEEYYSSFICRVYEMLK